MSLTTLNLGTCRIPSVTGENGSIPNASKVTLVNTQALPAVKLQMEERDQPLLQESSAVSSRREMMQLTAVSFCVACFFFPATAEARPRDATVKQQVTGKLEELKGKAGQAKPNLEELKDKAGQATPKLPKLEELKDKAGQATTKLPKLEDLKDKAGQATPKLPKLEDLKEKAGLSKPKSEELKEKAGLANPKFEELKEKAGLPKPKDEGKGYDPKDNGAKLLKPTNEIYGSKAKSIDGVA